MWGTLWCCPCPGRDSPGSDSTDEAPSLRSLRGDLGLSNPQAGALLGTAQPPEGCLRPPYILALKKQA